MLKLSMKNIVALFPGILCMLQSKKDTIFFPPENVNIQSVLFHMSKEKEKEG